MLGGAMLGGALYSVAPSGVSSDVLDPARMARVGSVDPRFQSYNVEMVEVTGGRFWKPYKDTEEISRTQGTQASGASPAGMNPNLFEYRPPIDLKNARLRKLAAALGPAYVRVSGTWANTTYFYDADGAPPKTPPKGFNGILTRKEWAGVVDFAKAVDARIVTSFTTSPGTRTTAGVWTPEQARQFLSYTKSLGGSIAAAEFMNEPNLAAMGGAPKGYTAADYARDVAAFRRFLKQAAPETLFLGPGSVAEGGSLALPPGSGMLRSQDLLKATGPVFDAFSYHLYAGVSKRCAGMSAAMQTTAADALSQQWLSRAEAIDAFYAGLRDRYDPGKPLWITETADAACGGNRWASTFLDTFRYLNEHASLAQRGVQVIAHNTLASSDYGLLDENTFVPRPNYWAALLWGKLMGATVLKPKPSSAPNLHLYAQCLRDTPGGVSLLAINADRDAAHAIDVSAASERYVLTAPKLEDTRVELNGKELSVGADDALPELRGVATGAGRITLAPASITFLAVPGANNASCR
jgi:hypothetical protein